MLGFGSSGEVWRARDLATGEDVALKRLRPGAGPDAIEALRREAAVLRTLDTPYVVGLRDVLGTGAEAVLVLDLAAGGSLATLLSRRGRLSPGEVVTVAAPLAEALAAAHARGLLHGDVSPSNVLFTADGMPLLTDLGAARPVGDPLDELRGTAEYVDPALLGGADPGPASDVWALGALCFHLLTGSPPYEGPTVEQVLQGAERGARAPLGLLAPTVPRALVSVVEGAMSSDPTHRPTAASLVVALQRAQAPAPVRLVGDHAAGPGQPAPVGTPPRLPGPADRDDRPLRDTHRVPRQGSGPVPPGPARRRPPASVLTGLGVVLVLLAGGLVWAFSTSGPTAAAPLPAVDSPAPQPVPAAPDPSPAPDPAPDPAGEPWRAVLGQLDRTRQEAFATGDADRLLEVYAPGSAAGSADAEVLLSLTRAGLHARGVQHDVTRIDVTSAGAERVVLRVVDVLTPHELLADNGALVEQRPGRGERSYDLVLTSAGDGWLIAELTPTVEAG